MADMITQYLASRGAVPSAENASRVRQHYASNPDLLDRRAVGLPGGLDDNSAVLDAMLDKHIAESMPQIPQGSVEVGQPEKVPPPSKTAPAVKGKGEVGGTDTAKVTGSRQANYGPATDTRNRQANYDVPTAEGGNSTSNPTLDGTVLAGSGSQIGDTKRSGITEMLLTLLGGGAAAYGLSKMGGKSAPDVNATAPLPGTAPPNAANAPVGRAPAPYGSDAVRGSSVSYDSPAVPVTETDPDAAVRRARMEAEVAAENDAMARQMEQEALQRKRQTNTEELARAARRATGRR
jgi:hypothetical protein